MVLASSSGGPGGGGGEAWQQRVLVRSVAETAATATPTEQVCLMDLLAACMAAFQVTAGWLRAWQPISDCRMTVCMAAFQVTAG